MYGEDIDDAAEYDDRNDDDMLENEEDHKMDFNEAGVTSAVVGDDDQISADLWQVGLYTAMKRSKSITRIAGSMLGRNFGVFR